MCDAELLKTVFPQLAAVLVQRVVDEGQRVRVVARTRADPVACPRCGTLTARVHGYHRRWLADLPVGGRPVVIELTLRRLVCPSPDCSQQTFREQVPGLAERYARRTPHLGALISAVGVVLAGRAGARLLSVFAVAVSCSTVLRLVMALPLRMSAVPRVLSVDDVALRRHRRYATLLIDAVTHRRIDVLPNRKADSLAAWLREHPGVRVVCRDGSLSYAEAIRQGAPDAVQVSDRWHLWKNLGEAVEKTVVAHSRCWHAGPPRTITAREEHTRSRHAAVHTLLDEGVGLLECARRLGWALNTVKRYARADSAEALLRPPQYRRTLVDPYRDHLRRRLADESGVAVTRLLAEIREQGYPGSATLLVRYLNQGRADPERIPPSPRRLAAWLMSRPEHLPDHRRRHRDDLVASCPQMTALAARIRAFAALLTHHCGQDLDMWMKTVRDDDLPFLHAFVTGLDTDHDAVVAGLTLPYSNGPMEGANTKVKLIKRQMYGRAEFPLLRQRILLS
ncbi:ISL3 family transposase [Frankia coriariae]|uniref:Transposase n=1 Tax=Protofrankia coriariae TaxID=1562887 RepID=A0ABR5F1K6_9ACTN|nr:transposase [Protofrankia coriariae]